MNNTKKWHGITSRRSNLFLADDIQHVCPLSSPFVIHRGAIKMIPLSPPCSRLRKLLNVIHCHLICDQVYNGSGKLEGTVLCLHWRRCAIQANCWLSNCISLKRGFKGSVMVGSPSPKMVHALSKASDNRDAWLHVLVSLNLAFTLISSSIFVGHTNCIAAVLLN